MTDFCWTHSLFESSRSTELTLLLFALWGRSISSGKNDSSIMAWLIKWLTRHCASARQKDLLRRNEYTNHELTDRLPQPRHHANYRVIKNKETSRGVRLKDQACNCHVPCACLLQSLCSLNMVVLHKGHPAALLLADFEFSRFGPQSPRTGLL